MATRLTSLGLTGALTLGGISLAASLWAVAGTGGTTVITSSKTIYSSGGLLPLYGALTLTEVSGTAPAAASGSLRIRNPYDQTLLCEYPRLNITTTMTSPTYVDVYTSTGTIAQVTNSGTTLLQNNLNLKTTGIITLSGSSLRGSTFKLAPYDTTTSANGILFKSLSGTNLGLVGTYYVPCYAID